MTIPIDTVASAAPWTAGAAYLYAMELDELGLAWEYLRRHPGYVDAWRGGDLQRSGDAVLRWGLRSRR